MCCVLGQLKMSSAGMGEAALNQAPRHTPPLVVPDSGAFALAWV